jgi:hypothetical protein
MIRDVGVGQLVEELEERGDRLPFEIGAFVALEACEGLLQESVKLATDDVRVTLEGSVVVADSAERAEPDEAARSLVSVLARLLVAAGPGVPPYLLQLVQESTTGQAQRDLRHLHDAIEASLIPINRGASRRVLARLVRESDRPAAPEAAHVDPLELDAELDELLRDPASRTLEPAPAESPSDEEEGPITERIRMPRATPEEADSEETDPGAMSAASEEAAPVSFAPPAPDFDLQPETIRVPTSEPALKSASVPVPDLKPMPAATPATAAAPIAEPLQQPRPEPITATIRKWPRQEDSGHLPRTSAPEWESGRVGEAAAEPTPVTADAEADVSAPDPATASDSVSIPSAAPSAAQSYDRQSLPAQLPKRRGGWGAWLLAAGLGLGAYALITTGTLDALLRPVAPPAAPAQSGLIDVTVRPADAQIFVYVGRGPAVASDLLVGGVHEFIVFDRGLRPSRAVVPEGATWTSTDTGALYELAVQAPSAVAPNEVFDLGAPQATPASAADGNLGAVRIITNPQGAKVYRFVGVGPTVQIPTASIHEGQEVVVYHPEYETRRSVIGPSDWRTAEGGGPHGASLEVELPPRPASVVPETLEN